MALPKVITEVDARTEGAEKGFQRVEQAMDRMAKKAKGVSTATGSVDRVLDTVGKRTNAMSYAVRNAAFQLSDFAVQVSAGAGVSRALALQLPQLLGGFGTLGAVASVAAAVLVPLAANMAATGQSAQEAARMFGVLAPAIQTAAAAMGQIKEIAIDMANVVVNNLDRIVVIAGTAATVFAARYVAGVVAAAVATVRLSGALVVLRGALIRTGVGALIVGLGELAYQTIRVVQALGGVGPALLAVKNIAAEVFDRIRLAARGAFYDMKAEALALQGHYAVVTAEWLEPVKWWANKVVGIAIGAKDAMVTAWKALPRAIGHAVVEGVNTTIAAVETMLNTIVNKINDMVGAILQKMPDRVIDALGWTDTPVKPIALDRVPDPFGGEGVGGAAASIRDAFTSALGKDYVGALGEYGNNLMGMADVYRSLADMVSEELQRPIESVNALREALAQLDEQGRLIDIRDWFGGAGSEDEGGGGGGGKASSALDEITDKMRVLADVSNHLKSVQQSLWSSAGELLGHFAQKSKAFAIAQVALNKARAIAEAIQNTGVAVTKALAVDPTGALAARVAAWGRLQVAMIAATGLAQAASVAGGSGGRAAPGGGAAPIGQAGIQAGSERPVVQRSLTLIGDTFGTKHILKVAEFLNEASDDGLVIRGAT